MLRYAIGDTAQGKGRLSFIKEFRKQSMMLPPSKQLSRATKKLNALFHGSPAVWAEATPISDTDCYRMQIILSDNITIDGSFQIDRQAGLTGIGHVVIITTTGTIIYDGAIERNQLTGKARVEYRGLSHELIAVYHGHMRKGKRNGKGCLKFLNTGLSYDGKWKSDTMHGYGKCFKN
jgi:hypothetical protein